MGLHVEVRGESGAPDVVMLHGWAMHGGVWGEFADRLAGMARLHVFDLPGHGLSRCGGADGLESLADAVLAQAPPRAAWLGWSLGGMVALTAGLRAPQRVSRLALVATSACFTQRDDWPCAVAPDVLAEFADGLERDVAGTVKRLVALQAMGAENARAQAAWVRQCLALRPVAQVDALRAGLDILARSDLRPCLAALSQPVALLAGAHDPLVPQEATERMGAMLSNARLTVFRHSAHAPFLSEPEAAAQAAAEFLRG
ncbi:MAG: pimeloyl-ACP methyl ester esterase BioH [Betaproteobacteria bacterium]|nr:pimeloyl-ACP methyl ester esterase BioH [Betaproteobacteria bacterium]